MTVGINSAKQRSTKGVILSMISRTNHHVIRYVILAVVVVVVVIWLVARSRRGK